MPKRVTNANKAEQLEVIRRYAKWRGGLQIQPAIGGDFAPYDYTLREPDRFNHGRILEVVEVKCRHYTSTSFRTVWVETRKVRALREWSRVYDCTGIILVRWIEGLIARCDLKTLLAMSGPPTVHRRGDREEIHDTDEIYEMPIRFMEVVP